MNKKVVIMCAGKGRRLLPLTENKPKCMVEVNGKAIIDYILEVLDNLKLKDIIMITGYKEDVLKAYLKDRDIHFITQKEITGTSDAIYLCKDFIDDDFVVLSGDIVYDEMDVSRLVDTENSILYTDMETDLYEYGTFDMSYGKLNYIYEKSTDPVSNFVNCGAYHFSKDIFKYIPKTEYDPRFNERIVTNTINLMIDDGYEFSGIYIHRHNEISRPSDIEDVERHI